jgi:hypothetical protein
MGLWLNFRPASYLDVKNAIRYAPYFMVPNGDGFHSPVLR